MNWLDLIIGFFCLWGLFRGISRGIIKEAASIAGALAGGYVALVHFPSLARHFTPYIETGGIANILAFFVLFTAVFLGVTAIGVMIKYFLKIAHLGNVDKVFGAVFGVVKGVLVSSVVVFALTLLLPSGHARVLENSHLAPPVTKASGFIVRAIPPELKKGFDDKLGDLKKVWSGARAES